MELTSVAETWAEFFDGERVERVDGLKPDTTYEYFSTSFQTLPHPGGELLSRFGTVNDVHIGEQECGRIDDVDMGPILRSEPGETPYATMMAQAAVNEMLAADLDLVVAKGDLTGAGTVEEYNAFMEIFVPAFGEKFLCVRGNHDAAHEETFAAFPTQTYSLPGVGVALLDTTLPGKSSGDVTEEQADWLATLAGESSLPLLVFGHHHPWNTDKGPGDPNYFGISPQGSQRLVDTLSAHSTLRGYFCGHTHRNRVRRFAVLQGKPVAEVSATKDFPGVWAEYRVFEGGTNQVVHRIAAPAALRWTNETRKMFEGFYGAYSFGTLTDRCFTISHHDS